MRAKKKGEKKRKRKKEKRNKSLGINPPTAGGEMLDSIATREHKILN